jgi:hypothetical protein
MQNDEIPHFALRVLFGMTRKYEENAVISNKCGDMTAQKTKKGNENRRREESLCLNNFERFALRLTQ